jgi:hypothetical protein
MSLGLGELLADVGDQVGWADLQTGSVATLRDGSIQVEVGQRADLVQVESVGGVSSSGHVCVSPAGGQPQVVVRVLVAQVISDSPAGKRAMAVMGRG